jgi:hypothetical protein
MKVRYFICSSLSLVAFLFLTLFVGRPETAPSVEVVTELIKGRINRMTSVLISRQAEMEAYRESQDRITNVSAGEHRRTPAEIEAALTAQCERQIADLKVDSVWIGQADAEQLGDENYKTRVWPIEFEVLNPTEPSQNLHAVMFCYRGPEGGWNSKVTKVDLLQNGTIRPVPKYAFREMGLE